MITKCGKWYVEIKIHTRITDYFNISICNFPILVFRRYEFGLHEKTKTSTFCFGIFGITFNYYSVDK